MILYFCLRRSNHAKAIRFRSLVFLVDEAIYASNSVARTPFFPFFPFPRFLPESHPAPPAFFGGAAPAPAVAVATATSEVVLSATATEVASAADDVAAAAEVTAELLAEPVPVPVEPEPSAAAAVKRMQSS